MRTQLLLSEFPADFRDFAREWSGLDMWSRDGNPWVTRDVMRGQRGFCLPLHVPACDAMVCAYIATRLGAPAEAVAQGVVFACNEYTKTWQIWPGRRELIAIRQDGAVVWLAPAHYLRGADFVTFAPGITDRCEALAAMVREVSDG